MILRLDTANRGFYFSGVDILWNACGRTLIDINAEGNTNRQASASKIRIHAVRLSRFEQRICSRI